VIPWAASREVLREIADAARSVTVLPGDSYGDSISGASAVFIQDADGNTLRLLLDAHNGDDAGKAVEFFIDIVLIAYKPDLSSADWAKQLKPFVGDMSVVFHTSRHDRDQYIRDSFASTFKKVIRFDAPNSLEPAAATGHGKTH
jgi:hypothetical protein